ncbi:MAG: effector-associated domain EAD1-containing protein [Saprospiraceae bacterium]
MEIEQITNLEKEQYEALEDALNSAFPSFDELTRMYKYTFGKNLELPPSGTLVFKIIGQAEATGKVNQLIEGAFKANPENPKLKAFIDTIKIQKTLPKVTSPNQTPADNFKYFEPSVLINDITPDHIMDLRANKHKDFYYERDFDAELLDLTLVGESILLLGNSLAGKTRAIYELIKKIASRFPDTCLIFPKNIPIDNGPIKLPLREGYRHIAFIEDIDDYYKNEKNVKKNYDKMIRALIRGKVQIFATCRTGPEYKEYKRLSKSKVREVFRKVMVGKVKREVVQEFDESIIGDIEQKEFDGNIGSIFMDIEKMRDRYQDLLNAKTNEAEIAIKVMRALKTFYFASNFTRKSAYDAVAIKDYCLRLCVSKNASEKKLYNNSIVEQFGKQEKLKLTNEIETFNQSLPIALSLLESDEDNLNFIKQESNRLEVEEVYLEKIVRYSPFKLIKDIDQLYDAKEEKKKNGFYVKTNNYNKLLKDLPYPAASSLFYEMRSKRIMPNADSYSLLIEKSDTYQTAIKWFEKLESYKIPPNESVLMAMINKADEYETAYQYVTSILDLLKMNGTADADIDYQYQLLTNNTFSLRKTISFEQIEQYLDAYQERFIPVSSSVFNIISQQIVGSADINIYLKWIQLYQIEPDLTTLNVLIQKSSSLEEALGLLSKDWFKELPVSDSILSRLLEKAFSLEEGLALLEKERFNELPISESVLNRLLSKASSLMAALDLLVKERFNELPIGDNILSRLLEKASSLEEGLNLLEKERFNETVVSESILHRLLSKSSSLEEALDLMAKERFNKLPVTDSILSRLLEKASSFEEGLALLKKEQFSALPASESILNVLLRKLHSLEEALALLEKEPFSKLPAMESVLNVLLSKAPSLEEALDLMAKERFNELPVSDSILSRLLEKASSLEEGLTLLEKEQLSELPVSEIILSRLLEKASSLEEGLALLKKERFSALPASESILNVLLRKLHSLEEALALLKKERFSELPVSESILNVLLEKFLSLKEGLDLLQKEPFNMISISESILSRLLEKSSSLEEGLDLLEKDRFNKIPISESILSRLLEKSSSLEEGLELLAEDRFNKISVSENIFSRLLSKSSSLAEAIDLLKKDQFSKIPINESILHRLFSKASSLEEGLDLLKKDRFNKTPINESTLGRLLSKASSLEEGLNLLENDLFNKIPVSDSIVNRLLEKSQTTEDIKKVANLAFVNNTKVKYHSLQQITFRISNYKDLLGISIFWDNYTLFPEFSYIDFSAQNFEDTISYFKNFEYHMTKFSWSHMIFLLLNKMFIKNKDQKDEIITWFDLNLKELQEVHEKSFIPISLENHLFPDIKEMWDNYKFPTD